MQSTTILVTGGAGYIGSHTVVALIEAGYSVVIIDDLSNSRSEMLGGIEQITGTRPELASFDLCDAAALHEFFQQHSNIGAVIHFAASKAVGESVADPLKYYRNNLYSLINLLGQMKEHGVSNLIFSSSCTVYGQPDQLPVTEATPVKPAESPYGNTKQIAEEIIRDTVAAEESLQAISLRYFNPVGAHASGLLGELPLGTPANLVPFITQTAAGIREKLRVFGDDYDTADGSCVRDYIHVVDLAEAHLAALRRLLDGKNEARYECFNVGTGAGQSVLEVINTFERVNEVKLNYEIAPRRVGDIEQIYADTTLANQALGWRAERSLEDMMRSAWRWQQNLLREDFYLHDK
ncbi:MAG: UDP-glucose 4-epimerase GalE [Tunicatimonas sp.]